MKLLVYQCILVSYLFIRYNKHINKLSGLSGYSSKLLVYQGIPVRYLVYQVVPVIGLSGHCKKVLVYQGIVLSYWFIRELQ